MNLQKLEKMLRVHDQVCEEGKEFGEFSRDHFIETAEEALAQGGEVHLELLEGGVQTYRIIYKGKQE